jgi:adenylate cyclase class 2
MNIEYEATFTKINKDQMRQKLKKAGAKLIKPEFLMRRHVYQPPIKLEEGWLRVRDEGDKITMALKQMTGKKISDQKEIEFEVSNYETACKLLETIGCFNKSYQETLREIWQLNEVEITIDTWPGLQPIVEIEGQNEDEVKKVAAKLDFTWVNAIFWSADEIYERELGIPREIINNQTPEITFKNPPTRPPKL